MYKCTMQNIQIRVTVSKEVDKILDDIAKKLGKKKSTLARELMEQKLYDVMILKNLNK